MTNPTLILAQSRDTSIADALDNFFESPIGVVVGNVLDVVAVFLAFYGLWMIIKAVKSPNPGAEIAKKGLWPFVAGALVLKLNWTTALIGMIQNAVSKAFESVVNLFPGLGS